MQWHRLLDGGTCSVNFTIMDKLQQVMGDGAHRLHHCLVMLSATQHTLG